MIDDLIRLNHGVVSTGQLVRIGLTSWEIRQLVAGGRLSQIRRGWFAGPEPNADVHRAIERGGALSCISALKLHGLWTPPFQGVHFRRSKHHRRPSPPHCRPHGPDLPAHRAVDSLGVALLAAARCRPTADAVVLLDSAVNLKKLTEADLVDLFAGQPAQVQRLLRFMDVAESGTETYIRMRLRGRGIKLRPQVEIDHVGRVDLLVGERLVIEADSRSYHDNINAYHNDRLRDRTLSALGYRVVRLTYADVMTPDLWAAAEADLLAQIRRRDHCWPRRRPPKADSASGLP